MPFCQNCGGPVQEGHECLKCGAGHNAGYSLTPPGSTEETLQFIFDSIADGIVVVDLEANIVQVNETVMRLGGFSSKEEVLGKSGFSFIDEASMPKLLGALEQIMTTDQFGPVEYTAKGVGADAFVGEAVASLMRDSSGNPTGIIAIIRDISERKKAEEAIREAHEQLRQAHEQLQASQEQLIQSAKLAAVGELVSGVAHEVNNPLMAIAGYAEILLKKVDDRETLKRLQRLYDETVRATTIVRNLLSFARKQEAEMVPVSINEVVDSVIQLRGYEMSLEDIEIETGFNENLPLIMADFQQLQQVFLNLLINAEQAIRATGEGGKVVFRTKQTGDKIQVRVVDTGPGIPVELQSRIFEPFFTTKRIGEGTGLGLSICYGIIESHHGHIEIESHPGKGTTFSITLPIADS